MSNPLDPTSVSEASGPHSNGLSRSVVVSERPVLTPVSSNNHNDDSGSYQYDIESEQWNFQKLLAIILRRQKVIGGIFLGIMALMIVLTILTPRVYRTSAQIIIDSDKGKNAGFAAGVPGLEGLLDGAKGRSQETEIQILQSQPVKTAALELLPIAQRETPITALEVRPVGDTDLVSISTSSTDPKFARDFTNKLCEAYVQQTQEESNKQYADTAVYLKGQLASLKAKMDRSSDALRRYKEENSITDLSAETAARIERFKTVQESLQAARVEREAGLSSLQRLQASAASIPKTEIAPNTIGVRPVVAQYEAQLTTLRNKRNSLLGEFQPGSPEVRAVEDEIKRVSAQLAKEPKTEVQTYTRNVSAVRETLEGQIATLRSQNAANSSRISTLQGQLFQARQDLSSMPQREFRLSQLQMELSTYQQAFQTLNDKYIQVQIGQAAPVANARVLTLAGEATQIKPNVRSNIVMGTFMALVFGILGGVMADRLDNRIHSDDDIREATQLPVLAYIPKLVHFETESIVALAKQDADVVHTPLLESYRMLRTSLMFTVLDSPLRCIMMTSSQPNEGKSSVAANLATVLAMNGKSVLLIDADLRRPSAHRLFGLSAEKGFSTVAAGICTLEEALQNTPVEGLRILGVGPTPPNPPEMLDSRASRQIFQDARQLADFVIIDAPPALMMADAQIIATEADGILLVVSWEEALKNAVAKTTDLLSRTGVKMLGVVVNKWDDRQAAYQNYYEKHYSLHSDALEKKK
jgi:capsular exopolysaccharide synthesis family protein